MSTRKHQLENLLRDPEFRHQFVGDYVQELVATQIRAIREHQAWTQEQLGEAADGMSQVQVSRLENPDYSGATLNSLKRVAQAFDLALVVRMVPFGEFVEKIVSINPDELVPPNYDEEQNLRRMKHQQAMALDAIAAELHGDDYRNSLAADPMSTQAIDPRGGRTFAFAA